MKIRRCVFVRVVVVRFLCCTNYTVCCTASSCPSDALCSGDFPACIIGITICSSYNFRKKKMEGGVLSFLSEKKFKSLSFFIANVMKLKRRWKYNFILQNFSLKRICIFKILVSLTSVMNFVDMMHDVSPGKW